MKNALQGMPAVAIVAMSPGSRALLAVGNKATIIEAIPDNGVYTAKAVLVGKDGRWPPK